MQINSFYLVGIEDGLKLVQAGLDKGLTVEQSILSAEEAVKSLREEKEVSK